YCCFGGCCSTGTESEALKLLWRELEDVAILQLSLKHESSSVRVEGCCSTGAESEA
uniref:(2Fe-2S)-binding protein n=1 Tax=Strongyloides stercoralis TaxID=6248 RepID=A0A0K0E9J5_STRER